MQEQREDTSARDMSVSELHIPVPEASAESAMPSAAQWDETESNNIQSIDMGELIYPPDSMPLTPI